ncbi:MAG: geranylgeranyl reductase family protein [Actinomycetia bacterium]|nr:geranylgeranyl reductase family protein [Actinomycetes bacterium]
MNKNNFKKENLYDILIVGGGPAGSTAGYILAKDGFNVILLDKNYFPRPKLCGGLLPYKTIELLTRIYKESEESLIKNKTFNFISKTYKLYYKKKQILKNTTETPFYLVDRSIYDTFLLSKAKEAGVKIIQGEKVEKVNEILSEVTTLKGNKFRAKIIIGADGVYSVVRKHIFSSHGDLDKWKTNLAETLQIEIKRTKMFHDLKDISIYFNFINYGYCWIFPNKDKVIIGIGGLHTKNKKKIMHSFANFLSILKINLKDINNIKGYSIPFGNFLLKPAIGNIILLGDAAGFVNPLIGEGIFYAQRSAELASLAIKKNFKKHLDVQNDYIKLINKDIILELQYSTKLRNILFQKIKFVPVTIIKNLLNSKNHAFLELIQGRRSYASTAKKLSGKYKIKL